MKGPHPVAPASRRAFLAGSAAATAAATLTIVRPEVAFGSRANSTIDIGLIGCGGRGSWIAGLFRDSGKFRLVAGADYFEDRTAALAAKFGLDPRAQFTGLSGARRILDEKLDAVVIETPPYFHPKQAADAVAAGKHVYLAKPIAVDVPGCQSVEASGKLATEKKLVFLVDFQTRTNPHHIEVAKRVHAGAIGKPISGTASYLWSMIVHPDPVPPAERLRAWYQSRALSGDAIVEQDIHALDVATWLLDAAPEWAVGTGGRNTRKVGETWDTAGVTFAFPGNIPVVFSSQKGVPGIPDEIRFRVFGTEGVADTDYSGPVSITGKNPYPGGSAPGIYEAGAKHNIGAFYDAIAGGQVENATVAPSVRSNLTCVLGRTAAYAQGTPVTWKEMIARAEELTFDATGLKD